MGQAMPYRVLLPPDYSSAGKRYSSLYLLHGLFGSFTNWTELACLGPQDNLIIIMPEAADGWYCDCGVNQRYESWLLQELIPEIDREFRTDGSRAARSIAGNSMGGYGAIKIALRYPEMFRFAASTSGAFGAPTWSDEDPAPANWQEYRPSILRIFGPIDSKVRSENDVNALVSEYQREKVPAIYFDCGISDPFLDANRKLSSRMRDRGMEHRFRILPGGHDWHYWAKTGKEIITMISKGH
jgi:S-formylglutathione hydrolase FrmB